MTQLAKSNASPASPIQCPNTCPVHLICPFSTSTDPTLNCNWGWHELMLPYMALPTTEHPALYPPTCSQHPFPPNQPLPLSIAAHPLLLPSWTPYNTTVQAHNSYFDLPTSLPPHPTQMDPLAAPHLLSLTLPSQTCKPSTPPNHH